MARQGGAVGGVAVRGVEQRSVGVMASAGMAFVGVPETGRGRCRSEQRTDQ